MANELTYTPLIAPKEIRILTVHAGDVDELLCCSFSRAQLGNSVDFEAISYTWGSDARDHVVSSPSGSAVLHVPASCYAALCAVRNADTARTVWIDSICINQDDLEEKGEQVSMMGQIYAAAKCTLVYLGEDDGTFRRLARALESLRRSLTETDHDDEDLHPLLQAMGQLESPSTMSIDHAVTVAYLANEIEYRSQDSFEPLQDFWDFFFHRPWFTRLWVIQEVALSKRIMVYLGRQKANWGTVMALYNLVNFWFHQRPQSYYGHPLVCDRSILGSRIFNRFQQIDEQASTGYDFGGEVFVLRHRNAQFDDDEEHYQRGVERLTLRDLVDLLFEMRTYGCKDDRDRLFAILSLFDGSIPASLKPNYQISNTAEKVFANITQQQIDLGCFDILACAQGYPIRRAGLPSWACDWTSPPDRTRILTPQTLLKKLAVATKPGMTPMRSISSTPNGELVLRGMIFDEITFVGGTCPIDATKQGFLELYSSWIWSSKVAHAPELGEIYEKVHSGHLPADFFEIYGDEEYINQDPLRLIPDWAEKTIGEYARGRAFATVGNSGKRETSAWRPSKAKCLVPSAAEEGDLVCGLLGFGVAVVLRPVRERYRFVGTTTCWNYSVDKEAPGLRWDGLLSRTPQAPLRDFRIF